MSLTMDPSSQTLHTAPNEAPPYAASFLPHTNVDDLLPPTDEHDDQGPPPDYDISFADAYAQWVATGRAINEASTLESKLRDAKAELAKEQVVLTELKEKSATLFDSLHKKRNPLANLLTLTSKKGKSKATEPSANNEEGLLAEGTNGDDLPSYTQLHGEQSSTQYPEEKSREFGSSTDIVDGRRPGGSGVHRLSISSSSSAHSDGKKSDKLDKKEKAKIEFEHAHADEMKQAAMVEALNEKVDRLNEQVKTLQSIANSRDSAWNTLRHAAEKKPPSAPLAIHIGQALERMTAADAEVGLAKQATADLTRARLTVQHAHHYFTNTLRTCDAVKGSAVGRATIGMIGGDVAAMSKLYDYRAAVTLANKAQVCLKECFRVLQPHLHTIPPERRADYDALQEMGLMQMLKIYNLLYGGRIIDSGVSTSIKHMYDKQEKAFAHLTHFAVWVQNRVPECEAEEKDAVGRRDEARSQLIHLWLENHGLVA